VTHAFFKSLLFLGAGVVILAVNHEHDIFAMGGIARKSPFTFWTFLIGALALAAIPPTTAGLSSKDMILSQAWQSGGAGKVFWALGIAGAFITSIYIFRLIFIVFGGTPRTAAPAHGHASAHATGHAAGKNGMQAGAIMGIPLFILTLLCLAGGLLSFPQFLGGKPILVDFLQTSLPKAASAVESSVRTEWILSIIAEAASLLGIPVAWMLARRRLHATPAAAALMDKEAHVRFFQSGWGFDWIYDHVFVRPFMLLAQVNARDVVDRFFDGVGGLNMLLSRGLRWTQNGRVRWYAAGLAAGAVLIAAAVVLL
jgi:NADH-quinone oxidoreductase subunit L